MASDWEKKIDADGRRYYFNLKTQKSVHQQPVELMTPEERVYAWQELSTPDGKNTYFYNTVTKESAWTIPDELKVFKQRLT